MRKPQCCVLPHLLRNRRPRSPFPRRGSFIDYGSAHTADHPLLARRIVASGCLQKKRLTPGGLKIESRGGQSGVLEAGELLGGSWAPDGLQDRSGSAPGRNWGGSWAAVGAVLPRPGGPREEANGKGSGRPLWLFLVVRQKKLQKAQKSLVVRCFCCSV